MIQPLFSLRRRPGLVFLTVVAVLLAGSILAQGQTAPAYAWTNFAGQPGGVGNVDSTGSAARFFQPIDVAVDTNGNVFVADHGNSTIRKVTAAGVVTTLAGSAGNPGRADGTGSAARFYNPRTVAMDGVGNLFVADNNAIRKVTAAGVVTTLAGDLLPGHADGTGRLASFFHPTGVAVDSVGSNVYVADTINHTIRKVTAAGVVTTLAGSAGSSGSADGTGSAARFNRPSGVAVDSAGNLFVADSWNHTIRKVTAAGVVTTLAGSAGSSGSADGTGNTARFNQPNGVAVDSAGNLYVADFGNNAIRKVTPVGTNWEVTTLAGVWWGIGSADGTGSAARFCTPSGVAVGSAGNVYVADTMNHTIRKVTAAGVVTTLAGLASQNGSADGTGSVARFTHPSGVAVDSAGNLYVADLGNNTIRKVTPAGVVTTLAGDLLPGHADGTGRSASFYWPSGVAVDSAGNLFVADSWNHTIRKVTAAGVVTTLAGSAGSSGSADGTGSAARFNQPNGVAVDSAGSNVYVADSINHTIRKVTAAGVVTTLAGSAGSSGSADGTGSAALFDTPVGVAVDSAGNVFVADTYNDTIRKVTAAGVVTTLAGSAWSSGSADGTGSAARFDNPTGVSVDTNGNVFVADKQNCTIRKVTPTGVVTTIGSVAGVIGWADGIGSSANFSFPSAIAVDTVGNLYVAEFENNRITKGTPGFSYLPPTITLGFDGTHLHLSWTTSCLGWELQAQTNSLNLELGTNWFPVPGSTNSTQMSIPINPASPCVFYRLRRL